MIPELQKFNSRSQQPSWAASLDQYKHPELSNTGTSNVLYKHRVRTQGTRFSHHHRLKQ